MLHNPRSAKGVEKAAAAWTNRQREEEMEVTEHKDTEQASRVYDLIMA